MGLNVTLVCETNAVPSTYPVWVGPNSQEIYEKGVGENLIFVALEDVLKFGNGCLCRIIMTLPLASWSSAMEL